MRYARERMRFPGAMMFLVIARARRASGKSSTGRLPLAKARLSTRGCAGQATPPPSGRTRGLLLTRSRRGRRDRISDRAIAGRCRPDAEQLGNLRVRRIDEHAAIVEDHHRETAGMADLPQQHPSSESWAWNSYGMPLRSDRSRSS